MNKKKKYNNNKNNNNIKEFNSGLFFIIYISSIIILISFFLNFILIIFIFLGYFLFIKEKKKDFIKKTIKQKDIELYIEKYNKINKKNFKIDNYKSIERKYKFPHYIIFSLHATHETFLEEKDIRITDRMIELFLKYENITVYGINYYSKIFFPTEKGIKKNAIRIIQKIINKELSDQIHYRIGFDCWSMGTCIGLYCINHINILDKNMEFEFIDLRTPPLNIFNLAYQVVNLFIYSIYPIIILFQYDDFFNNNIQIKKLIKNYPYINIYFYIPNRDKIVNVEEQNKLLNIINYKYFRNVTLFCKGKSHNSKFIIHGYQLNDRENTVFSD